MEISELPTRTEAGAESGNIILSGLFGIDLVLVLFSFSLLQSIHNFTSEMQFRILWTVVYKWSVWQESSSLVSSAKD